MSKRRAISPADEIVLADILKRRDALLTQFAPYSLKAIAAQFGISKQTVYRYSSLLLDGHRADVRNTRQ